MPKLIIKRRSSDRPSENTLRHDALAAVRALPDTMDIVVLLENDEAVRIEYTWKRPRFDVIEGSLNRCGLTCME